jgi:hypothetical protein
LALHRLSTRQLRRWRSSTKQVVFAIAIYSTPVRLELESGQHDNDDHDRV